MKATIAMIVEMWRKLWVILYFHFVAAVYDSARARYKVKRIGERQSP